MTEPRSHRGRLVNIVCLLVCVAALAFIVPAGFGLQRYVIAGRSMTGSIDRGSVVYEEVVPVGDLRIGDVITYLPPADSGIDHLVTHRIVAIHGDSFRTKGDANSAVDPWTFRLQAARQPRVVLHVPYAGYPLLALQQRDTRLLVIGVPAVLVFLLALGELLGLGRRRTDDDTGIAPAPPTGPVVKVLVPRQPAAADAAVPRRRIRLRRSRTVDAPLDAVR